MARHLSPIGTTVACYARGACLTRHGPGQKRQMAHYACDPGPAKPDTRTRPRPPGCQADGGEVPFDASYLTRTGSVWVDATFCTVFEKTTVMSHAPCVRVRSSRIDSVARP